MKKRALSLILAAALACAMLPMSALAADSDFTIEDGVLMKYHGPGGHVVIPDSVTAIGPVVFRDRTELTAVTIPDSVGLIGWGAFQGCTSLTSVDIPGSVGYIANQAFEDCIGLTSVTIGNGVYAIQPDVFSGCKKLTTVDIPGSVTSIGSDAFKHCTSLTSITIPDSVTEIGGGAFAECSSLTSVTIPKSVTNIEYATFSGCTGLTSVTIPDGVTSIGDRAFKHCSSLTSITIPNGVTCMDQEVFYGCTSLTSVVIPKGVTSIEWGAFGKCTGLVDVTIPDGVTRISREAFDGCTSLPSVAIPSSVTSFGWWPFRNCTKLTDVYYGGTEDQWKAIKFDMRSLDDALESATIHYAQTVQPPEVEPSQEPKPTPADGIAYPSTQKVDVDGQAIEFQCYALKDEKGNDTNYIKLRDLADILNGSAAQFEVGWNGNVTITTGTAYTPNGSEHKTPFSGQREYRIAAAQTLVNGEAKDLAAFTLTDDNGGGYTYYKLRDLGEALGFKVDWSKDRGIFIETK